MKEASETDDAHVEYLLAEVAERAHKIKEMSKLSIREIANRMGLRYPWTVQRLISRAEPHNATLSTLVRFSRACGFDMDVKFRRRKPR